MDINLKATILIAHADAAALDLLKEALQGRYHVKLAASGADVVQLAALAPRPDLILLDAALAGIDSAAGAPDTHTYTYTDAEGAAVLRTLRGDASLRAPLVLLINDSQIDENRAAPDGDDLERALWRAGASDIVRLPISGAALRARVALHVDVARLRDGEAVAAPNAIEDDAVIIAMASLAEAHDPNIGKHLLRTRRLVAALAVELQFHERFRDVLTPKNIELIVKAAPLHDIGKATVDPAILKKPGRLSSEEFAAMREHTISGRDAIEAVARTLGGLTPFLRYASEIACAHQEKWDGSGYPHGLKGEEIPLAARLMAAADVYDALVTARSYRPAFTHETAIELIRQGRGEHFDPDVADAVLVIEERFRAIAAELADGSPASAPTHFTDS